MAALGYFKLKRRTCNEQQNVCAIYIQTKSNYNRLFLYFFPPRAFPSHYNVGKRKNIHFHAIHQQQQQEQHSCAVLSPTKTKTTLGIKARPSIK